MKARALILAIALGTLFCSVRAADAPYIGVPPRTIQDVVTLLEQFKPDPVKVAKLKADLALPEPVGATRSALTAFHLAKARAADGLGARGKELEARRKLLELNRGLSDEVRYLTDLAGLEVNSGNFASGLAYREEIVSKPWLRGVLVGVYGSQAALLAERGEVESAGAWLSRAEGVYAELMTFSNYSKWYRHDGRALIEIARGRLFMSYGRLTEAEQAFRNCTQASQEDSKIAASRNSILTGSAPPPEDAYRREDRCETSTANVLIAQGRLAEAEWILRDQLGRVVGRVGRYSPQTSDILLALSTSTMEQGRFSDAEHLARITIETLEQAGVEAASTQYGRAVDRLGEALLAQGRFAAADEKFNALRKGDASALFIGAPPVLAALHAEGALDIKPTSSEWLRLAQARYGQTHYETGQARALWGIALAKSGGEWKEVLRELRQGIQIMIDSQRGSQEVSGGALRKRMFTWILEDCMSILMDPRTKSVAAAFVFDPVDEAFSLSDLARGQSVQRAVAASAARASTRDPLLAQTVRNEQDLGQELAALYGYLTRMLAAPSEQQLPKVLADMRTRIGQIQAERETMIKDIERRFPDYANLINPKPPRIDDIRRVLRPGETYLGIYVAEHATYIWAIPQNGRTEYSLASIGLAELTKEVAAIRRTVDPFNHGLPEVPSFNLRAAQELYRILIKPVEAALLNSKHLLVAASGPLDQLPFSLLPTDDVVPAAQAVPFSEMQGVPWLIKSMAVTQLPLANALLTLRALPARDAGRTTFAGFGDPLFSREQAFTRSSEMNVRGAPVSLRSASLTRQLDSAGLARLPRLPDTAEEILGIAKTLGASNDDVFLQVRANEQQVKSMDLQSRRVIVFATHGLIPGEINGLTQPALAMTAPEVAGTTGDGLLTLEEILGLKIDADWVVLSACNTASADGAGAGAVSGLGRAFFYAGTRALLVSNWPVETVSAKLLTTGIFSRQAADPKLTRAEALRQTMLEMIANGRAIGSDGKPAYSYAHPLFWAPFTLVGEGG